MKCKIEGCEREVLPRHPGPGMSGMHYKRWWRHGDPNKGPTGFSTRKDGYVVSTAKHRKLEHIMVAEKALGRPLPPSAVVHHVDGNPSNNANNNLVVCENQSYHLLLHRRSRALKACGNPNYERCNYCKTYDDPTNMKCSRNNTSRYHAECRSRYRRARYAKGYRNV